MSKKQRRGIEEFSVSFLDVICCGFGAIILLLMITKTVEPIILEQSQINLEGVVEDREDALFEIRGQVRELRRQVTDSTALLDDDLLELQGGFEYESCCWAFRTVIRRYLRNRDGDYRDGIYLELNLKGLASIGSGSRNLFP